MKPTNEEKTLEPIHIKCIENLPLMIDVMADTIEVLRGILKPQYEEISKKLKEWKKSNRKWKERNAHGRVFPFKYGDFKVGSIETPDKYFEIRNLFDYWNKDGISVQIWGGFCYTDKPEEDVDGLFFYYAIDVSTLLGKSFYEKLIKQIPENIKHLAEYDKSEYIQIYSDVLTLENIKNVYEVFRDKILQPFLDTVSKKQL